MIEKLQWHDTCKELPDAGSTVLLWVRDPKPFANPGWMTGYLDEGGWHDSETSHALTEIVTHWADPNGPVHNAEVSGAGTASAGLQG